MPSFGPCELLPLLLCWDHLLPAKTSGCSALGERCLSPAGVWVQVQGSRGQTAVASRGLGGLEGAPRIRPSSALDSAAMIPIIVLAPDAFILALPLTGSRTWTVLVASVMGGFCVPGRGLCRPSGCWDLHALCHRRTVGLPVTCRHRLDPAFTIIFIKCVLFH